LVGDHATDRYGVPPAGVENPHTLRLAGVVEPLVERSHRLDGQVDGHSIGYVGRRHHTSALLQLYTRPGSGSQLRASSAPGSTAMARYSDAIATQSSVSAITAGLHAMGSRRTAKPSTVPTANV